MWFSAGFTPPASPRPLPRSRAVDGQDAAVAVEGAYGDADLARDLRLLVRERLVAGDSDAEVVEYVTDRYGEYVLLQPRMSGANWLLWGAGPLMLVLGLGIGVVFIRRRGRAAETERLSEEEEARLQEILRQ